MRLLSLFSGIGAFEKALCNLKIPFELVNYCEFDKYASKSYSLIHGVSEDKNLGDITKVDETTLPDDIDILTYGFPCQDISLAGNQQGLFNTDGTRTRSGLFFDALRIINHTSPKIAIAENVKNLASKKFEEQFNIVLQSLAQSGGWGYNNYWGILNSKDYGVPQNRERVFIVSIRKDVDTGGFEFPKSYPLTIRLKDVLEDRVGEKYFLSFEMTKGFIEKAPGVGYINQDTQASKVISEDGVFQTLCAGTHGYANGYVKVKEATKKGSTYAELGHTINLDHPNSTTRRGRVGHQIAQTLTTSCNQAVVVPPEIVVAGSLEHYGNDPNGIAPTITVVSGGGREKKILDNSRIRRLTPLECFRLMGFDDVDHETLSRNKVSNTQIYKQAGNSIVVDVLEEIFCRLFDDKNQLFI